MARPERQITTTRDQRHELLRMLVENVVDYAIFMLDPQGYVTTWNPGAQRIKGYAEPEIVGKHFSTFYPAEDVAAGKPAWELQEAARVGRFEDEGWRLRKDGSRFWANVLITAVFNAAGEHVGFAKVTRDTSERRRLEEDREHAATALAAANAELESLNRRLQRAADEQAQFVAVTAHELRTPVGLLAGSADLLAAHADRLTDEERNDVMTAISSGTSRLRRLLADLLTASRLQASRVELARGPVDVRELVQSVAVTVRSTYPNAEVVLDDLPDVSVDGDRDRLAQVLENFAGNAVRHGAPPVRIGVTSTDSTVLVRVSDSGTGVPAELRDRLFDRFSTGRNGGTGLGLYIARQLARAHGGDARYEPPSSDHPGGAFVLEVPRPVPTP
jgi:hypothetical protein